jgi:hypothetical protein
MVVERGIDGAVDDSRLEAGIGVAEADSRCHRSGEDAWIARQDAGES